MAPSASVSIRQQDGFAHSRCVNHAALRGAHFILSTDARAFLHRLGGARALHHFAPAHPPAQKTQHPEAMNEFGRLASVMAVQGQAARRSTLFRHGISRDEIEASLASGFLVRPMRGWYATGAADSDQLRAIMAGARLGCVSALRRWGVWSGPANDLHLHCAPTSSRLRLDKAQTVLGLQPLLPHPSVPPQRAGQMNEIWRCGAGAPVVHWSANTSEAGALDWIVSPTNALAQAVRCQEAEHAVACIDSALHLGAVSVQEWESIRRGLPERLRPLGGRVDARAGSGNESIVRLRLRAAGFAAEPQVQIPGVGRVDLVVDELVALEVDSEAFHSSSDQRRTDRDRTLLALAYGMPSMRIGPEHLTAEGWSLALTAVARQVADARTLLQLRTRTQL